MALVQGRLTWRHDSVLQTVVDFMRPHLREGFALFSNLPSLSAGSSTFPPDIIVTAQRPDLVLIDRVKKVVVIFELTCPWDTNVTTAHIYKQNKYAYLVMDLSNGDFTVDLYCFEVSVRGQISKQNKARIKSFLLKCTGLKHGAHVT